MKILVLNWKDHHHPLAGGAEDFTYNIMKRLAQDGHEIVWFTSLYPGAKETSHEDGIDFVRSGSYRTVHGKSKAFIRAISPGNKPDVILDEVNTRPFNPSRWLRVNVPVVNLIHQLAREVWFQETPLPVALVGRYALENYWLKAIKNHLTVTVSESTEEDLRNLGFERIRLVYNALEVIPKRTSIEKDNPPKIVYLGRLSRGKRPKDCLEAFRLVRRERPCTMTVMGDGPLMPTLQKRYPEVDFLGHVSETTKRSVLSRATFILASGTREGWNRGVLEAQAYGVVPVVQNIHGLRDAVGKGKAGIMVPTRNPKEIAKSVLSLFDKEKYLRELSQNCIEWASLFSYSKSKSQFESVLTACALGEPDPYLDTHVSG
jgi:glycosyltransferase involved in cell wall biosynthesis